jgi:hypothetical protein
MEKEQIKVLEKSTFEVLKWLNIVREQMLFQKFSAMDRLNLNTGFSRSKFYIHA